MKLLNVGDTVWYSTNRGYVLESKIVEVVTFFSSDKQHIIHYEHSDFSGYMIFGQPRISCTVQELLDQGYIVGSQSIWIDEPVGHGLYLDIDIFLTLSEALNNTSSYANPKRLKALLRSDRMKTLLWLVTQRTYSRRRSTNLIYLRQNKILPKDYPDKKVYTKKS